jgi:hypothetical protein
VNKIMGRGKILSSFAGALMLTSMLSFSNALADTNTPTIPQDGQLNAPGQAYLDPSKAPYAVGSLTSTLNVQGFYQSNPYTDSNAVRQEVRWYHPNSSWVNDPTAVDGKSIVSFGLATVSLEDGSGRTGNFYLYNIDTLNSNNGYGLISVDDVPAWVQMLGGDLNKIQQDMANGTLDASSYMDDFVSTWHVVHLGQLAKLCGWTLAFDNGTDANNIGDPLNGMYVAADQTIAKPTFKLFPNQQPNPNPNGGGGNTGGGGSGTSGSGGSGGGSGTGGGSGGSGGGSGSGGGTGGSGGGGTIIQNPGTSDGDISVKFANYLWNHWPKNGETGHVDMILTNTNDYDGAGIEYDLKAWSDDNLLFQPVDIEKAVVNVPAGQSVTIPLTYKVQREFKDYKWQGYHIHYTVTIRPHVIPTSDPDDPPPPPLNDSDSTNDTAKLDQYIIGPPRLVK